MCDGVLVDGYKPHFFLHKVPTPQNHMYQLGLHTHEKFARSNLWQATTIGKMLRNAIYTGVLVQNKYECDCKRKKILPADEWIFHQNSHPAIINPEQFDAVQSMLDNRKSTNSTKKLNTNVYVENVYAGKISCARCGKAACRSAGGNNASRYYYGCRACIDHIKYESNITRAPSISLKKLDEIVMKTVSAQMDAFISFDSLLEQVLKSETLNQKQSSLRKEKSKLETAANQFDRTLSAAYTHYLDGLLDAKEFEMIRTKIERDRLENSVQLATICQDIEKREINQVKLKLWRDKLNSFRNIESPTKEMVQLLVNKIHLTPITNEVSIEFNFRNDFLEIQQFIEESEVVANA